MGNNASMQKDRTIAVTVTYRVMTHKGLMRSQNEDAHYVAQCVKTGNESASRYLFAVADGLGGHHGGAIASRMALKSVRDVFLNWQGGSSNRMVSKAIERANEEVFIAGHSEPKIFDNMQTTLTAVALEHDSLAIGHVGDCRLYRVRNGSIGLLTRDHTMANDMLKLHMISQEQVQQHPGRHQLTRSIGSEPFLHIDVIREKLLPDDTYLLCSDGLWSELSNEEIHIAMQESNISNACEKLVGLVLRTGAPDNITAVMFRIETIGEKASSPFSSWRKILLRQ